MRERLAVIPSQDWIRRLMELKELPRSCAWCAWTKREVIEVVSFEWRAWTKREVREVVSFEWCIWTNREVREVVSFEWCIWNERGCMYCMVISLVVVAVASCLLL
jgi:hypothetical protein